MLKSNQRYQYNFIQSYPIIRNAGPWGCEFFEHNFDFALKYFDKFTILCPQEVFSDFDYLDGLYNSINKYKNKEIYISCSTTSKYKYSLDPLLNIVFWRDTWSRNLIAWDSGDISIFDKSNYLLSEKNIKFILSSRKKRKKRDYIFDNLKEEYDGIVRYASWPEQGFEDKRWEIRNKFKFPTFIDMIKEYNSSFIAFVIETDSSSFINQISEKTFLPFLTKCIPIILPNENKIISEIKSMGFYIFNDFFGLEESSDELENLNAFIKTINKINKLEISEIKEIYNKNISKIEYNYELINFLLNGTPLVGHTLEKFTLNNLDNK